MQKLLGIRPIGSVWEYNGRIRWRIDPDGARLLRCNGPIALKFLPYPQYNTATLFTGQDGGWYRVYTFKEYQQLIYGNTAD